MEDSEMALSINETRKEGRSLSDVQHAWLKAHPDLKWNESEKEWEAESKEEE